MGEMMRVREQAAHVQQQAENRKQVVALMAPLTVLLVTDTIAESI